MALTAAANCCRPGMRAAGFAAENACMKASCDTSFSSAGPAKGKGGRGWAMGRGEGDGCQTPNAECVWQDAA